MARSFHNLITTTAVTQFLENLLWRMGGGGNLLWRMGGGCWQGWLQGERGEIIEIEWGVPSGAEEPVGQGLFPHPLITQEMTT